jgi:hypothetical protein
MRGKLLFLGVCAAVLVTTALWAGDPWKDKPYTRWTVAEVYKVLENSPWVHSDKVFTSVKYFEAEDSSDRLRQKKGSPIRRVEGDLRNPPDEPWSEGVLDTRQSLFYFEWSSSLTVRQAIVRQMQLANREDAQALQQLLGWQPAQYVISVYGSAMSLFAESTEEGLRLNTSLELNPGGKRVSPAKVEFLRQWARLAAVRFYFPRETEGQPTIVPQGKKARFRCNLQGITIGAEFDLRKMTRDGHPDL